MHGESEACERVLRTLPEWFGIEAALQGYVRDTERHPTFVARVDEQVVGFVTMRSHFPESWEVHCIGVRKELRRVGIGRALLSHAESWAASQGARYIQVKTLSQRAHSVEYEETRSFYLRLGYVPMEEHRDLWSPGNPCLQLIKAVRPRDRKTPEERFQGVIRGCAIGDLDRISELSREWEVEGCTRGVVADRVDSLSALLSPYFLCAVSNGEIVGYARGEISSDHLCVVPCGAQYLVLHDLFVARNQRGRGIGSALLYELLSVARGNGVNHFTTYTANIDWPETVAFYGRFGFKVWSVSMFGVGNYGDEHTR